jgi:hypothetical protein
MVLNIKQPFLQSTPLDDILNLSKMVLNIKQSLLQSTPLDDTLNLSKMVLISKSRYCKARH